MASAHTPGPWIVEDLPASQSTTGAFPETTISAHANEDGSEGVILAFVNRWDECPDCREEWQSNARLIAAAPDLLAACEGARTRLAHEAFKSGSGVGDRRAYEAEIDRIHAMLDSAIALARKGSDQTNNQVVAPGGGGGM